jgi:hypothetical protein
LPLPSLTASPPLRPIKRPDGKPSAQAYQEAGFTGGAANARRKKASQPIKRRVAEILAKREAEVMRASGMMAEEIVYHRQTVISS